MTECLEKLIVEYNLLKRVSRDEVVIDYLDKKIKEYEEIIRHVKAKKYNK